MKSSTALQLPQLPGLEVTQHELPISSPYNRLGVTFRDSKTLPVHRWYPYVEGFSADYLRAHLNHKKPGLVYDPFGGSGTVNLEASKCGLESLFSEVNPFMRFVAETKVNARFRAKQKKGMFADALMHARKYLVSDQLRRDAAEVSLAPYNEAFRGRDFFVEEHLRQLLAIRNFIQATRFGSKDVQALFLLAVASVVVHSSNRTRRADLRRRRKDEYIARVVDVPHFVLQKLNQMEQDILLSSNVYAPARFLNADARNFEEQYAERFTLILTSPPYLNGTNYIRNTKLELCGLQPHAAWLLGRRGVTKRTLRAVAPNSNSPR
jgi:adenine-specific DNA methylase